MMTPPSVPLYKHLLRTDTPRWNNGPNHPPWGVNSPQCGKPAQKSTYAYTQNVRSLFKA